MKTTFKGLKDLKKQVSRSPELLRNLKEDPEKFIKAIQRQPLPIHIPWIFLVAAGLVGIVGIICVVYIGQITIRGVEIPPILGTIATSAITAIAGLLAPSPLQSNNE